MRILRVRCALPALIAACLLALPGIAAAALISGGNVISCSVSPAGQAECWGANTLRGLGVGATPSLSHDPLPVIGLGSGVTDISAGANGGCAVQSGAAKCWGTGSGGVLGDGVANPPAAGVDAPVTVAGFGSGVTRVSRAGQYACGVRNGGAYCWGNNHNGRLGNGSGTDDGKDGSGNPWRGQYDAPVPVTGMGAGVTDISAGWRHACAIQSGTVKCWGGAAVGYGPSSAFDSCDAHYSTPYTYRPQLAVCGLPASPAVRVEAGSDVSCALLANGSVWCWGSNTYGVMGSGTTGTGSTDAKPVTGLGSGVVDISLTASHGCALLSAGTLRCWGNNHNGQLGNGTGRNTSVVPTDVVGLSGVTAVGTGDGHTCAIAGGQRYCWGSANNGAGNLGNEAAGGESFVPVPVVGRTPQVEPTPTPTPPPTPTRPTHDTTPGPPPTATFTVSTKTRKLDAKRRATVATLGCPAGTIICTVTVPSKVTVKIGGKRYSVKVQAPKTIAPGRRATVRVTLTAAAAKRLRGRTATVAVKIAIRGPGGTTTRTVSAKLKR